MLLENELIEVALMNQNARFIEFKRFLKMIIFSLFIKEKTKTGSRKNNLGNVLNNYIVQNS